jgi:hypothetical protein
MTIPPRKEEQSYNYSLRVGERLGLIIGVRSLPLLQIRCKNPSLPLVIHLVLDNG